MREPKAKRLTTERSEADTPLAGVSLLNEARASGFAVFVGFSSVKKQNNAREGVKAHRKQTQARRYPQACENQHADLTFSHSCTILKVEISLRAGSVTMAVAHREVGWHGTP